jgi:hypothetical protein
MPWAIAAATEDQRALAAEQRPVVKQISMQRSTNSETDFETVAELSGDRTSYVDEDIRPATSYFYRFVLEYKATHVPMRGVSFAAVAYDNVRRNPRRS